MKNPPIPKKIKKILKSHNDQRIDNYFWLRDDERKDKKVIEYLHKENEYSDYLFKKNKVKSKEIFKYYKYSLPKLEKSFKKKIDGYHYYSTSNLSQEYRKYYRIFKKRKNLS